MTLKECIRQRSLAASTTTSPHIPYRGSKLTLLLKEAFELASTQPTKTVFVATISPLQIDISASLNTLRYASSLLVIPPKISKSEQLLNAHPDNIFFWSHEQVLQWLQQEIPNFSSEQWKIVVPFESGNSLAKVPELEFIRRIGEASNGKVGEKRARSIYLKFWDLVVESRTRSRVEEKRAWKRHHVAQNRIKDNDYIRIYESMLPNNSL